MRIIALISLGLATLAAEAQIHVCEYAGHKLFTSEPCAPGTDTGRAYKAPRVRVIHPAALYAPIGSPQTTSPVAGSRRSFSRVLQPRQEAIPSANETELAPAIEESPTVAPNSNNMQTFRDEPSDRAASMTSSDTSPPPSEPFTSARTQSVTGMTIGNQTFYSYSDPKAARQQRLPMSALHMGNTTFFDNGMSSHRFGNMELFSNGTSSLRAGNMDINSNGTSCQHVGTFTFCN